MPRSLAIIVPIYKNAELVTACIESILTCLHEISDRSPSLLLINDSPDDEPVRRLLEAYEGREPAILVIHNSENMGFVRTVNDGLGIAQREMRDALLVNSDTITFAGTLRELARISAADPQIGFVAPRSNNASICSYPHFHGGGVPDPEEAHRRWHVLSRTMPAFHFTPTAVGFYLWVSYGVLANFGGLNTDFGIGYEEENDLVMRAGKVGFRAVLANHAFAYHAGSASFTLTSLDLPEHKLQNLRKLCERHAEFMPLVRRYEASPWYRAERLMGGLLTDSNGRIRVVFDLGGLGRHHNGTSEHTLAVLRSMAARWADRIALSAIGSPDVFEFHDLNTLEGLVRVDPNAPGQHAVAIRMGQPFDLHDINVLESVAPVNVFGMLDTIAEDCGPLAVQQELGPLWDHVARHSNGLLFNSRFSQRTFCARHPEARQRPHMAALLPTRLSSYRKTRLRTGTQHVLILGNHFAHKGSDAAGRRLATAYPTVQFVVLGSETFEQANLTSYRSGGLDHDQVEALYLGASVVVLPSYVEGFGLGFMHALAAGRTILARRIPPTEEILETLDDVEGVFLFDHDPELVRCLGQALASAASRCNDQRGATWDDWADEVARFCIKLADGESVFEDLVQRITSADSLRKAKVLERLQSRQTLHVERAAGVPALTIGELMKLEGRAFVEHAYATVLQRQADAAGLEAYMTELESGLPKVEMLRALAASAEGLAQASRPHGLEELLAPAQEVQPHWLKRLFIKS